MAVKKAKPEIIKKQSKVLIWLVLTNLEKLPQLKVGANGYSVMVIQTIVMNKTRSEKRI